MPENIKEIITSIGRRLREASNLGRRDPLPEAMQLQLDRLRDVEPVTGPASETRQAEESARFGAHPVE